MNCPCHSDQPYSDCCKSYHEGKPPENALKLMRSRYAAYALGLADYIMDTTHPDNPRYSADRETWKESIEQFSKNTVFVDLKIESFEDGSDVAFVTFNAILAQNGQDASFTEKSRFLKVAGRWLYRDGQIIPFGT